MKLQFRPRARIIRTIGDQLISGPEAAVIELVKNAYDADASFVTIKFVPPLVAGDGRITVRDDGHGMTLEDIQDKWMEPATSAKSLIRTSPRKSRSMMGSKGIGRFAAAKLGRKMGLASVSDRSGKSVAVLIPEIDWSIFTGETYLSEIEIDYLIEETSDSNGTDIEIRELNEPWSEVKLRRLYLELRRLISPFETLTADEVRFKIFLDLSLCTKESCGFEKSAIFGPNIDTETAQDNADANDLYQVLPFPLLTACDYEVVGRFDDGGNFVGTMQNRRAGQGPAKIDFSLPMQEDEESCGVAGVHFFIFDREANILKENFNRAGMGDLSASAARELLDQIAGIAIYRDNFRIRPYGDPANDWLTLDRRRIQDPSLRIGHNQIAGYINVVRQQDGGLIERSSREGFEENAAFNRLKNLIRTLLAEAVEPRRYDFRQKAGISRRRTTTFDEVRQLAGLQRVKALLVGLPDAERVEATAVLEKESSLLTEKIDALEDRQRILEAKSSLGAIVGEVLHEGAPAAGYIGATSARLQSLFPHLLNNGDLTEQANEEFPRKLRIMKENGVKLTTLFTSLQPLAGGKRGPLKLFRPVNVILSAKEIFGNHATVISVHGGLDAPEVMGHPDDLTTAMVNLFGNSIYWLEQTQTTNPTVDVRLFRRESELLIYVEDNGPGVSSEFIESIFDVGFTLKEGGTGLGLNIARESLARSGATLAVHLDYEHGARFEIRYQL